MQLLDDDMDELFRNAAANYPLKTGEGDWNAIAGRLKPAGEELPPVGKPSGKLYRWLWLLLLTPLFFIDHLPEQGKGKKATVAVNGGTSIQVAGKPVSVDAVKGNTNETIVPATQAANEPDSQTVITAGAQGSLSGKQVASVHTPVTIHDNAQKNNGQATAVNKDAYRYSIGHQTTGPGRKEAAKSNNDPVREVEVELGDTGVPIPQTAAGTTSGEVIKADSAANVQQPTPATAAAQQQAAAIDSAAIANQQAKTNDPVITALPAKAAPKDDKKDKVQKGFYIGIVASPDISTVKGQKVSNVGYGAGILAGYRISRRIAVETGILWDKKYYYSNGEYFSTKKIPPAQNMNIIDVDGWCRMFEIPVNVRYFFKTGKKSTWYASAGLSSYIMNREAYDYQYKWGNYTRTVNWGYDNATRNWFSIIHAGIGYERKIGVLGNLRVEPYLKIPAGGIGIGNLPVTSMGLNIGITRSIR